MVWVLRFELPGKGRLLLKADVERLAIMQENGFDRVQALEQLAKEKQSEQTTEEFLNDILPFYQGQIVENPFGVELTINSSLEMQGLSDDNFKAKMLDTLKSFKGNKIFNQSLNGNIEIRTSSIKKYKSFFADKNKRLIVPYIPELLGKAQFTSENTYTPETEKNIVAYWKADLPINIDNDTYNVHLTVKEDDKGNFFWDAQVNEEARRTVSATNPSVGGLTSEISEDVLSITPVPENVNKTLDQSDPGGQAGHRGQYDAGNRIITLFANADPSTIIHETAHFFLDDMRCFADLAETAEQLNAIYKYVGSLDGQISREQHEYFARSFEAYLMEGKALGNFWYAFI